MAPDGEIGFTAGALVNTQRLNFDFQVLPWLEGSFRYSHITRPASHSETYDRSFSMKLRVAQEGDLVPEISIGIRDLLGTGIYGSEYVVASKRFWDVDASVGLGWGRLADRSIGPNPFIYIFPSFKNRTPPSPGGGKVDFGQFFHGPHVGMFGGLIWHTPIDNLNLLVEYSSDKYDRESAVDAIHVRSPINIGVSYQLAQSFAVSAGWLYGSSYGATLTFTMDPTQNAAPIKAGVQPPPPVMRSDKQQSEAIALLSGIRDVVTFSTGPVQVAQTTADERRLRLSQALLSEGQGVSDFELDRRRLLINVSLPRGTTVSCKSYAQIASGVDSNIGLVAVTDLQDGQTSVCSAADAVIPAQLVSFDGSLGGDGSAIKPGGILHADAPEITKKIQADSVPQGLRVEAVDLGLSEMTVYYRNMQYFSEADAAGRLIRVLMADAPPSVEVFHLVILEHGQPLREIRVMRSSLERVTQYDGAASELRDAVAIQMPALDTPALDAQVAPSYPRWFWSIGPSTRQSVFDPNAPLQIQILAKGRAGVEVIPGLTASTKLDLNIWNNFVVTTNNSLLPHVRSDVSRYLTDGATGVEDLMVEYRKRLAPDVFAKIKAGYLESMYAGIGGEVLWRPDDEPFAVGADFYQVWQRNFDRLFGFRNYQIATGHVSFYYSLPWYGLHANLHVGRYLAGDYGATIEFTRRFSTGVEIGAYATFTNVPFSTFGEGSFDKGIIVRLPLEWPLPIHTTTVYDLTLRSLTRDGGQRLENDDSLYDETIRTGHNEIEEHLNDLTSP